MTALMSRHAHYVMYACEKLQDILATRNVPPDAVLILLVRPATKSIWESNAVDFVVVPDTNVKIATVPKLLSAREAQVSLKS